MQETSTASTIASTQEAHLPRVASISETAELFGLPVYFVRRLCAENRVAFVKSGVKIFVNTDSVAQLLERGEQ